MQNGDFPKTGRKFLDYREILHYNRSIQNGVLWAFPDTAHPDPAALQKGAV